MILHDEKAYAVLGVREGDEGLGFVTPGYSAQNARLGPVIAMVRALSAERGPPPDGRGLTLLQFDDYAHHRARSLAFGRPVGRAPFVELVMDPYFHARRGYAELRALSGSGALPAWEDRHDVLFWRGRGSHGHYRPDGEYVQGLSEVPRIRAALDLRDHPHADVKLVGSWIQAETHEQVLAFLRRERIFGDAAPMAEHARYRFQLDIDGVANAWATFERFLCGSCVLKVGSPFEMWFYDRIRPWEHYVPVKPDASDLAAQLDWCVAHPVETRAIAEAGRRFALEHTYEVALRHTLDAWARCRLPL